MTKNVKTYIIAAVPVRGTPAAAFTKSTHWPAPISGFSGTAFQLASWRQRCACGWPLRGRRRANAGSISGHDIRAAGCSGARAYSAAPDAPKNGTQARRHRGCRENYQPRHGLHQKLALIPSDRRPRQRPQAVAACRRSAPRRRVKFSYFPRQPLNPVPIEALQHGVDLLLALGGVEILQGLEADRLDGGGALKPPGPPLDHQLSRTLEVHSALADERVQERVILGRGLLVRLEARQLVRQLLEQEHGRRQLRAQGGLQLDLRPVLDLLDRQQAASSRAGASGGTTLAPS
jgi:hypothetical protein